MANVSRIMQQHNLSQLMLTQGKVSQKRHYENLSSLISFMDKLYLFSTFLFSMQCPSFERSNN